MEQVNKNWLYEFKSKNLIKKLDGSQTEETTDFALLKPNRRLREDGELFYAAETSRFAKAGVLPKAAWNTILSNGGGSISDKERELYGNLLIKFRDLSFELQSILIKNDQERSALEKQRSNDIIEELDETRKDIQTFESSQIEIFENTAEAKARNKTILWWVLNIFYKKENNNYIPFFEGESYEDKLNYYDSLEDSGETNSFLLGALRRATYLITLWFLGRAEKNEDFEFFDSNLLKEKVSEQSQEEQAEQKENSQNIIEEIKAE